MANVSFNDLQLLIDKTINTIEFNGQTIEVLKYLPVEDKKDLIQIAMQKSFEDGYFNDILLDVYFHLNLIYLYTNIEFTEEDKSDEFTLYNKFESNGLLDQIISAMDSDEYQWLYSSLEKSVEDYMKYKNSTAAVVQNIISDLPASAAAAADIVNNWDASKFQTVQDMVTLAKSAGMNPPIPESKDNIVELPTEE